MKKYLKYTAILMILSVFIMLAVSSMAGAILPASEQFHKPKIREGTTSGGSSNWAGYALDSPVGL